MKNLTNKEFKALARNTDGDIINLYEVWMRLTSSQHDQLTDDDWSRMQDYEEEARVLWHQAKEEFGYA